MKVIFAIASLLLLQTASAVADPLTDSVIINNFVFDSSGSPWLGDWVIETATPDTGFFFLPGAPPGSSAKWSLLLIPYVDPVGRTFTHLSSGIYQLSCWAKSIQIGEGSADLIQGSIDKNLILGTYTDSTHKSLDTNWIQYFLTDTLSLTSSDTFQIILSGEPSPIGPGVSKSLINNITFVKLPSSSGVAPVPNASANLRVYPNPFTQSATISITSAESGVARVTVVNLLGEEVARVFEGALTSGEHSFLWSKPAGLPNGMYECIVQMNGSTQQIPMIVQP